VAAVVPISRPHAIAAGLRSKAVAIALAVSAPIALIQLIGSAPSADPAQNRRLQSRFVRTLLRQPPIARMAASAGESASRRTCVMVLGKDDKLSVGFGEASRDTIVSLVACDLYNASGEAGSTELLGGASLNARNIFLAGGYTLAAGAVMTASKYLTTHASPVADPYSRLAVPSFPECTRNRYRLDQQKSEIISPGVYCGGIEVAGGATLHLDPGTYILDRGDFVVDGNSTVSGTGVTLILTSRTRSNYGAIDFHAGSTIELTAPARGAAAGIPGIAIWVDGNVPAASDTFEAGSTQNVNGAIYLPGRRVKYSGGSPSATRCSQLIARAVTLTGHSYFRHDCIGAGLAEPDPPPLLTE